MLLHCRHCVQFNKKETDEGCPSCVDVDSATGVITLGVRKLKIEGARVKETPSRSFVFDSAFDETVDNEAIYRETAQPLVSSFLEGYNSTVFAYGQTGSGKTHTMGSATAPGTADEHLGIIPRVAADIMALKDQLLASSSSFSSSNIKSAAASEALRNGLGSIAEEEDAEEADDEMADNGAGSSAAGGASVATVPHRLTASFIEIYCEKVSARSRRRREMPYA